MATRNGSPELILRTIGGCMEILGNGTFMGEGSLHALANRIIKSVEVDDFSGRKIIKLITHDGYVVMMSGDNVLFTLSEPE